MRRPRLRPGGLEINDRSRLADGLRFAWLRDDLLVDSVQLLDAQLGQTAGAAVPSLGWDAEVGYFWDFTAGTHVNISTKCAIKFTGALTLAFWFYPTANTRFASIWGVVNSTSPGYIDNVFLNASAELALETRYAGYQSTRLSMPSTNQWTRVVISRYPTGGTHADFYYNGVFQSGAAGSLSSGALDTSGTVTDRTFGHDNTNNRAPEGYIAFPMLWDRQLTADEALEDFDPETRWDLFKERQPTRTILFVEQVVGGSVGTSAGVATGTGVGKSKFFSSGTATGAATVSGVGKSKATSVGTAAGVATVTGVGRGLFEAVGGPAAGQATVSGIPLAKFFASGAPAGIATVTGATLTIAYASGTPAGVAAVVGDGQSKVYSVGLAAGVATVTGVSLPPGGGPGEGSLVYPQWQSIIQE